MGAFMKGDVVVIQFPFSDLSGKKKRPSLVLTELIGNDVILCQITGVPRGDGYSIPISQTDFTSGSIAHDSNVRPNHLFTADPKLIEYRAGRLSRTKTDEVIQKAIEIISS